MTYQYDVFISHASEDKEDFVRRLAQGLINEGYRVWYDEFSLTVGDSLSRSIDQGLSGSKFGIIVLSPNFIKKSWTKLELEGLVQKELNYGKVILPIWHQVTYKQVFEFSPTIVNKLATNTSKGLNEVINDIKAAMIKGGVNISSGETGQQSSLKLEVFNFETVKLSVDNKGFLPFQSGIKRVSSPRQAKYFVEDLGFGVKLEMVEIPGGTFLMGAATNEEESSDSQRPRHQVNVPPFFMGKYTITQEQWEKVAGFLLEVNKDLEPRPSRFKGDDHCPVESISWYDALEFCARLAKKTGLNYRLPSEAEWEYACRAGTTTPFYFGETITTEVANYDGNYTYGQGIKGNYREKTTPVGSFPPNSFGLYDMHGNVREWCLDDWHNNYKGAPIDGSPWFDNNDNLYHKQGSAVLRGGSWLSYPSSCRSASRVNHSRDYHINSFGFRVVCAAGRIPR